MTLLPPKVRYEKKFVAKGASISQLLALVRRNPALFREAYPSRGINNIYLDSPSLADYHDHIHGTADRSKTRVRWYGPFPEGLNRPVLERKIKRGHAATKLSYPLPVIENHGGMLNSHLEQALRSNTLPENLRSLLKNLRPALFNRYHRYYFVSADRKLRLTIDYDLQFGDPRLLNGKLPPMSTAPICVIELKFDPLHAPEAAMATNALPFQLTRCSKYVVGIERIQEGF